MSHAPVSRIGRWLAVLARSLPAKLRNPRIPPSDRRTIVAEYDVLGRPVTILANEDGSEVALDYSRFESAANPNTPEVPVEWVRALGVKIDYPRYLGLILARRFRKHLPHVSIAPDGTARILTAKGALSRINGEWKRGHHVPLAVVQQMRTVRKGRELLIAESMAALRYPKLTTELERLSPRTRILATGLGRTIVMDHNGARSHVDDRWVDGIAFSREVVDTMRPIIGLAEQRAHLKFLDFGDAIGKALATGLNAHVEERYGGLDTKEAEVLGLPSSGFTDAEIAESTREATAVIARLCRE